MINSYQCDSLVVGIVNVPNYTAVTNSFCIKLSNYTGTSSTVLVHFTVESYSTILLAVMQYSGVGSPVSRDNAYDILDSERVLLW